MKKELQKKLGFVLFVMAVFFAGMALTVFQEYIWMACIAGVLLLAASVFYILAWQEETVTQTEKTTELLLADRMAELMRGNEKAEKGVYIAVKKQHEAMESGMAALEERITELVKAQENAVKTLVMYNKENAKQMALSEREELGRLREELKLLQQDGKSGSAIVDAVREMSHRLYEELHENSEAILAELETTVDSLEEIKEVIRGLDGGAPMALDRSVVPTMKEYEPEEDPAELFEPELTEDLMEDSVELSEPELTENLTEDFVELPEPELTEDLTEDSIELPEPEPAEEPMMIPEAEELMTYFQEEEPAEEPVVLSQEEMPAEKNPEDAIASSGVDLSDPNKTLSADDIAALFAAMGN